MAHAGLADPQGPIDWTEYDQLAREWTELEESVVWNDLLRVLGKLKSDWERDYLKHPAKLPQYVKALQLINHLPALPALARKRLEFSESRLQQTEAWKPRHSGSPTEGRSNVRSEIRRRRRHLNARA